MCVACVGSINQLSNLEGYFVNHRQILEKIVRTTTAWETLRPTKSFSGRDLETFKSRMKPSLDVRIEIANLEAQLGAAVTRRNAVDTGALKEIRDIVHGVRGDREEGEDGELYEQMGYVRTSDRSTGLTRRRAMDQSNGGSEAA